MKTRLTHGTMGCLAAAVILFAAPGCRKEEPAQKKAPAKAEAEVKKAVDAGTDKAVEAMLAEADKFDGQTDKVVSKCPGCALGMDGSSEHALEVSGYKLHFCADACKKGFEKDTTKAILALTIPEN